MHVFGESSFSAYELPGTIRNKEQNRKGRGMQHILSASPAVNGRAPVAAFGSLRLAVPIGARNRARETKGQRLISDGPGRIRMDITRTGPCSPDHANLGTVLDDPKCQGMASSAAFQPPDGQRWNSSALGNARRPLAREDRVPSPGCKTEHGGLSERRAFQSATIPGRRMLPRCGASACGRADSSQDWLLPPAQDEFEPWIISYGEEP
ncbi:uncharacterized protein THITE_2117592 [Thermothielavioides terrestris NRRL 8126]|uniref:Uncharacterized protein n=1 Tax=Thermothielavioides terrestris (strain ATCC 38088 / NRRL 8126) TaxID=578455 RepID=G2R8B4_THETT|nr:uncharacterized protein THITE_2117592 [Thermothielavioides terrestris NRRL 8126]AEO68172.1 hypothetical protein THITE_2117592 [Thermothielavioides terrestris NRRL 8126]